MLTRMLVAVLLLAQVGQALPALAAGFPTCIRKRKGRYQEPATLSALLRCQRILREKHIALQKKRGFSLSADEQDALEEFQRDEVRSYLGRHPSRATMEEEPPAGAKGKKKKKKADAPSAEGDPGMDAPPEASPPQDGKGKENEPPPSAPSPEVVRGMIENLRLQVGDTPDLQDISSAVEQSGPTLSPWTLQKIKGFARKARNEGKTLNLDPETERWLLSD